MCLLENNPLKISFCSSFENIPTNWLMCEASLIDFTQNILREFDFFPNYGDP